VVPVATRDRADDEPFSYTTRADGTVVILYGTAPLTVLRGKSAARFAARVDGADPAAAQALMARAAGRRSAAAQRSP